MHVVLWLKHGTLPLSGTDKVQFLELIAILDVHLFGRIGESAAKHMHQNLIIGRDVVWPGGPHAWEQRVQMLHMKSITNECTLPRIKYGEWFA